MEMRGYQQYKGQVVDTMTQGELLLVVYDELVKSLMRAELAINKEEYELFEDSVDRALTIIRYLDDTLDRQYPIALELARLYDFFCYDLNRAKIGRNKTELERVKNMVMELRESFRTAQKNNDSGK